MINKWKIIYEFCLQGHWLAVGHLAYATGSDTLSCIGCEQGCTGGAAGGGGKGSAKGQKQEWDRLFRLGRKFRMKLQWQGAVKE
jgi:hypothetical protein